MKELKLLLNTGEKGAVFETEKIKGALKNLIISNKNKVSIKIISELGYLIYQEREHEGTHHFPLKSIPLNRNAHKINFSVDDFILNEKLIIEIGGYTNTDVLLLLRYIDV